LASTLLLVVVFRVVIDGAEQARGVGLAPVRDVLLQRFGDRLFLGPPAADGDRQRAGADR
jgi:hypothetical protein